MIGLVAMRRPSAARQTLSDEVYEIVREYLIDHRLPPGSRLVIDSMAEQLGVSQTPLREALARLEADQFVVKEPHRGYTVAPLLDRASFEELYEMRLLVEPHAAGLAARRGSDADLAAIAEAYARMRRSSVGARYREYRQLLEGDAAFHERIARASGNRYLRQTIDRLRMHQLAARLYGGSGVPDRKHTLDEHEAILEAIEARHGRDAETAMRRHLVRARDELIPILYG
jgi:DNA-binding GntR family transcriptional regulator